MENEFCQINEGVCIYGGKIRPGQCEGCPIWNGILNKRGLLRVVSSPYNNKMSGVFRDGSEFSFVEGEMVESRYEQSV